MEPSVADILGYPSVSSWNIDLMSESKGSVRRAQPCVQKHGEQRAEHTHTELERNVM